VRISARNSFKLSIPRSVNVVMQLFAAVMGMDHLAIVDIVGVAGDFLEEFEVLADQRGDVGDRVDMGRSRHQAAICRAPAAAVQFHGNSSGRRDTGTLSGLS